MTVRNILLLGAVVLFGTVTIRLSFMENQAQYVYHAANTRGHADHGWLDTYHSFSFASWHNPDRMHFGALRVLNDDFVAGGGGFPHHRHDNMEIISIPLEGELEHEDSMGHTAVIRQGDVQIMSAGMGIVHSEKNKNDGSHVRFLQIWIYPTAKGLQPSYDQQDFDRSLEHNDLLAIVSPEGVEGVEIHQNAWLSLGSWDAGYKQLYSLHGHDQGVYAFILEGSVTIDGRTAQRRDGLGIYNTPSIEIAALEDSRILLIEVPMHW